MKILAIIPARGGSKGVPRKNIRFIAGKPLINYAINNAIRSKYISDVVVSTDDAEIAHFGAMAGAKIVTRPESLAKDDVPLDPVIFHATRESEKINNYTYDYVITLQPTSPLLSYLTLDKAITRLIEGDYDTILSVVNQRHLSWIIEKNKYIPNYKERKNRQYLPANYFETGGFLISKRMFITKNNRFSKKIDLFEVSKEESIDIDSKMDWWVAEKLLNQKKILIRVDGYREIGMGHIYRTLLLANRLIDHKLLFVSKIKYSLGINLIKENNYNIKTFADKKQYYDIIKDYEPNIIINDILDTSEEYMLYLKANGYFTCNFEDMGNGTKHANIVINALYDEKYPLLNHYCGSEYFCLREEFFLIEKKEINKNVEEILITFGGTDPNNYTSRILSIIEELSLTSLKRISIIVGLGYNKKKELQKIVYKSKYQIEIFENVKNISKYMQKADLIYTSAGRTVFEVASIGTPTIVLAQNNRELRHPFPSSKNGFVNLKLGYENSNKEIAETSLEVINNYAMRQNCNRLMLSNDLKSGINKVLEVIFSEYERQINN